MRALLLCFVLLSLAASQGYSTKKNSYDAPRRSSSYGAAARASSSYAAPARRSNSYASTRKYKTTRSKPTSKPWWERAADSVSSSLSAGRTRFRKGVKQVRRAASETWDDVTDSVEAGIDNIQDGLEDIGDFLSERWAAMRAHFRNVKCRLRHGRRQYFDKKRRQWVAFTAEMNEFAVKSHLALREGKEAVFDGAKNVWVSVSEAADDAVDFLSERYAAVRRRLRNVRCRLRNGRKQFFDKARGKWVDFTADLEEFAQKSKLVLKEGRQAVFDAGKGAWVAVAEAVEDGREWLSEKWAAMRRRFRNLKCRMRRGRLQFFDKTKAAWRDFSSDMTEFAQISRLRLKEGREAVFDSAKKSWVFLAETAEDVSDYLSAKWASLRKRLAGVRCRMRAGRKEFFDKATQKWERFTTQMEEFARVSRLRITEGKEAIFDAHKKAWVKVTDAVEDVGDFLSEKWAALRAKMAGLRCRLRNGRREFFNKATKKWEKVTAEVEEFCRVSKIKFKEGKESVFDATQKAWVAVSNAVEDGAEWLSEKWAAMRQRFRNLKCRLRRGRLEFYDKTKAAWREFSSDMKEFAEVSKLRLKEGREAVFDAAKKSWVFLAETASDAAEFMSEKWANLRKRLAGVRCRVRRGVSEFYDASTQRWERFTKEMNEFAQLTKLRLKEGREAIFDAHKKAWVKVTDAVEDVGDFLSEKWAALRAKMAGLRCRLRRGRREFFNKATQKWQTLTAEVEEFCRVSKIKFKEGKESVFDATQKAWVAVSSSVSNAVSRTADWLSEKWASVISRLQNVRCRMRRGRKQFFDRVSKSWVDFTAEMEQWAEISECRIKEGAQAIWSSSKKAWISVTDRVDDVADFLSERWARIRARMANLRCRMRHGRKEFFNKATKKWEAFGRDMEEFFIAARCKVREGKEFAFDASVNAFVTLRDAVVDGVTDAGEFLSERWAAMRSKLASVRCRLRRGRREFYDRASKSWKAFTLEMQQWAAVSALKLKEGRTAIWDATKNAWIKVVDTAEDAADLLQEKWAATRTRLANMRCRMRRGRKEFFNLATRKWEVMTDKMSQFVDASMLKLQEGKQAVYDATLNAWIAVREGATNAIEWTAEKVDALFQRVRGALVGARCRLRAGRLEFQDRVSGQWREFTSDMKAFAQATRLNAIEGVDFVFDVARQSWEKASDAISNGLEAIDNKLEQAKEKAALARAEREAAAIAVDEVPAASNNSYEAARQPPVRVPKYNNAPRPSYN